MTSYTVGNNESTYSFPSDLVKICPFVLCGFVEERTKQCLKDGVAVHWGAVEGWGSAKEEEVVVDVLVFRSKNNVSGSQSRSAACNLLYH